MVDEHVDTAIVGGGVSGVYSAWRLKQAQPGARIVVFEGGDHIGGRLLSVRPPDIPNMIAELGGMRILPAVQPRITRLLAELNRLLPPSEQIETFPFPVDQPQNIAYLRGTYLRLSDFTARPDRVPYNLPFLERGGTPSTIIVNAIEQIVPGITDPSLDDDARRALAQRASFAGKPLYQQGFWNVLMRILSNEAYQLCADAGGYNSTLENWNAADAIPWYLSDFGVHSAYQGFQRGFQDVPLRLADLFRAGGGDVRLHARLDGFRRTSDGFELAIQGRTIRARTLILAMPRRSLELLIPGAPLLREIHDLITSVTSRPLFKLFTTYDNPWWRAAGVDRGRTVTDLPVRQTYYWPDSAGLPAAAGPAMLMASYDDGAHIGFWDGLRAQRRAGWAMGAELTEPEDAFDGAHGEPSPSGWFAYKASRRMVGEVVRQLSAIHGLAFTPEVRHAAFRDWGTDPFGGGWNSWNIGVKSWEVKARIVKPFDDTPLFICGEAYSDAQGWVEGALQTADLMLDKLGLPRLPLTA